MPSLFEQFSTCPTFSLPNLNLSTSTSSSSSSPPVLLDNNNNDDGVDSNQSMGYVARLQGESEGWSSGSIGGGSIGIHSKPRVSYYFPKGVGEFHFGVSIFFHLYYLSFSRKESEN